MKTLWTAILLLTASFTSKASHVLGGNISFTYSGTPNHYQVTMVLYRDCSGITFDVVDTICLKSVSCNYSTYVVVNKISVNSWSPCYNISLPGVNSCSGGNQFGAEKYVYTGPIVLPFACTDWELSYADKFYSIMPISGGNFVLKTQFDNFNFPSNSSPKFNTEPCFLTCVQMPLCHSLSAMDIDNDTIHYFETYLDTSSSGICPQVFVPMVDTLSYIFAYSHLDTVTGLFCFNVPFVLGSTIPYAVSDRSGGVVKSTVFAYQQLFSSANYLCATGLEENTSVNDLLITNTLDGKSIHVNFKGNYGEIKQINIHDISGKLTIQLPMLNENSVSIPLQNFCPGIYIVEALTSSGRFTKRFARY